MEKNVIGENSTVQYHVQYRESNFVSRTVEFFPITYFYVDFSDQTFWDPQQERGPLPAKTNIWKSQCPISNVRNITKKLQRESNFSTYCG